MENYFYNGLKLVVNHLAIEGYEQTKKHKKKRINKKWLKRYGKRPVYNTTMYLIDNTLYVSPYTYEKIKNWFGKGE